MKLELTDERDARPPQPADGGDRERALSAVAADPDAAADPGEVRRAGLARWLVVIGLGLTLIGAGLGFEGVWVSEDQALEIGLGGLGGENRERDLQHPTVRSLIRQSRLAMWGFALIAVGTTLQVVGVVMTPRQAPRVAQDSASGSAEVADTGRARPAEGTAGSIATPTKVKKQRRLWLNAVGLIFGMIGVVIIFVWGPPQPSFQQGVWMGLNSGTRLQDHGGKTVAEINAETAAKESLYRLMSQLGLGFVFVGFGCQLIAVWPRRSDKAPNAAVAVSEAIGGHIEARGSRRRNT